MSRAAARSMRSRRHGAAWSSRRNDAVRSTTRTITDIRSRLRIGSSTSWAGSTVRTRGVGSPARRRRTSSTWWLGPRRTTAACALQTQRPGVGFASDLLNLTLAGPRVNRYEKVDPDAAEWLPAQNRCWFAARVVAVRQRYGLTIDQREANALDPVLAGCGSTELITFARGAVPTTAAPTGSVSRGDRRVGRQPERSRQLRGGSGLRDRAGDAQPPGVSVHAGRRWRRRSL